MREKYTQHQICLLNKLRQLWEQHVFWTRSFIISTAANLGDLKAVTNRLLQNPTDFAKLFCKFYGQNIAKRFEYLFTQHLLIAADLVNAGKNKDKEKMDDARKRWYENANEIAQFLASINSCWTESTWRDMLYSHLEMTEKEAVLRLNEKFEEDVKIFDIIENEALKMADYMFCGIIKEF